MPALVHLEAARSHHGAWQRSYWMEQECTLGQHLQLCLLHQSSRLLTTTPGSVALFEQKHQDIELLWLETL